MLLRWEREVRVVWREEVVDWRWARSVVIWDHFWWWSWEGEGPDSASLGLDGGAVFWSLLMSAMPSFAAAEMDELVVVVSPVRGGVRVPPRPTRVLALAGKGSAREDLVFVRKSPKGLLLCEEGPAMADWGTGWVASAVCWCRWWVR